MMSDKIMKGFVYRAKLGPRMPLIRITDVLLRERPTEGENCAKKRIRTVYRAYDYEKCKYVRVLTGKSILHMLKPRLVVEDLPVYDRDPQGNPVHFAGDTKFLNCRKIFCNIFPHVANN